MMIESKKERLFLVIALCFVAAYGGLLWRQKPQEVVILNQEVAPASAGRALAIAPEELLIKFKDTASDHDKADLMARQGLSKKSEITEIGVIVASVPFGKAPLTVAEALSRNESGIIEFAEPNIILEPSIIPNDPWYSNWQHDKTQINEEKAWDSATSSNDTIAIIDTGVNCSHEDLTGLCVAGWNFYDNNADANDVHGHGTSVAGVAVAHGNNGLGVVGAMWKALIMPIRVSSPTGTATYSAIANAVVYAADHGAKVANASFQAGGSSAVQKAASYLKNKGGILIVSEGNSGAVTSYKNSNDIISVSAVDLNDVKYSWSSFGADVDIAAPGCTGAALYFAGGYGTFCGTSNSSPEVAGVLMQIFAANPSISANQAQNILLSSVKDIGVPGYDQYFGWGRVDAGMAVAAARSTVIDSTQASTTTNSKSRRK